MRGGIHAEEMLAGFDDVLQADGFTGYNRLQKADRQGGSLLRLAYCWSHGRREVIKAIPEAGSPIGDEILQRIAGLYAIEKQIRGTAPDQRRTRRTAGRRPRSVYPPSARAAGAKARYGAGTRLPSQPLARAQHLSR
jgi:transposase